MAESGPPTAPGTDPPPTTGTTMRPAPTRPHGPLVEGFVRRVLLERGDPLVHLARAASDLTGGAAVVVRCAPRGPGIEVAAHATADPADEQDLRQVLASLDLTARVRDLFLEATPDVPLERLPGAWRAWAQQHQPLRSLAVPLSWGDRVLGWLWVGAMIGPDRLDQLRDLAAVAVLHHVHLRSRGVPDPTQVVDLSADLDAEASLAARGVDVEDANQALDRLADVVGHEVRDAVQELLAWSRLGQAEGLDEGLRADLLLRIRRAAEGVGAMLGDALEEVAEVQAGRRDEIAVDLNGILAWVRRGVADALERNDAELEVAPALPTLAVASPTLLRATLLELVRNAVEHGGRGVTVTVAVEHANGTVGLVVRDDGPGIGEGERREMFEHGTGIGLGLARVRDAVARMGGTLAASAAPGGGTQVRVELPRRSDSTVGLA